MAKLAELSCEACRGDVPPLDPEVVSRLSQEVSLWTVVDNHRLIRTFEFPDFAQALAFLNRVAAIAEQEGHHPDLHLSWGKLVVETWTHAVNGLTQNDFILAAKIDALDRPGRVRAAARHRQVRRLSSRRRTVPRRVPG